MLFGALLLVLSPGLWATVAGTGLALDDDQRAWLAEHPRLRVGVVLQAPYAEFTRRQQQLSGLNVELLNALGNSLPVQFSWRGYPDQQALAEALRNALTRRVLQAEQAGHDRGRAQQRAQRVNKPSRGCQGAA